jgi:MFS family permease
VPDCATPRHGGKDGAPARRDPPAEIPPVKDPPRMRFPALRSRDFVIFTAGNFSATNAIWINRVIVGWLGWELTGLASSVGLMSFFLFAPAIVSSPLFGVILDRVDVRRAAILSQFILITTLAVLFVLYSTGVLTIWLLGVVALVIGFTASADRTIRFVLVPRIVEREALANAVAIHGINFNTARLIGPAIGGVLIEWAGTGAAILVNLAMVAPFLTVLFIVTLRGRDERRQKRQSFLAEIVDGARYAAAHPIIREAMVISGLSSITLRGILEILPAVADGEFHRGAQGLGQMLAVSGAGALVAAFFVAVRRSGPSEAEISTAVYLSIVGGILATVVLGLTGNWYVALAMVFLLGACLTINGIDLQASLQVALDDAYRGRVMGLWIVLVIGGAAISAIVIGFLADLLGMPTALVGSGGACAVLVGMSMLGMGKGRGVAPPGT